jgi:predicted DNA-binding protein (UPF0251 family)
MVKQPPLFSSFKPTGVRRIEIERIVLSLDEYEAIRLADYLKREHEEAAADMRVSRPTFTRLLERARAKVAAFLIEGKELHIEGGTIHFRGNVIRCRTCGRAFSAPMGEKVGSCPSCGSSDLLDMAGGYGHGKCCGRFALLKEDGRQ